MRFKLTLSVDKKNKTLPINYQYELSSWIYKTLNYGNPEFSGWLHENGYLSENKKFKLFTFSQIKFPLYEIKNDRIIIKADEVSIIISFLPPESIENFVTGLFKNQKFGIGDKKSIADFTVKSIERIAEPKFSETIKYRCLSPIFIDKKFDENTNTTHLSPEEPEYEKIFAENLISKISAFSRNAIIFPNQIKLSGIKTIRKKGITIKSDTKQQTKIIAYLFEFELTAPEEIHKTGYYAGFGRLNSQGFGCCEIIKSEKIK